MMKRVIIIIICALVCFGCARRVQFPEVDEVIYARVHIVHDTTQLPQEARSLFPGLWACAYPSGDIFVIGHQTASGLKVSPYVIGHELLHLLSWQTNGRVRNPDR